MLNDIVNEAVMAVVNSKCSVSCHRRQILLNAVTESGGHIPVKLGLAAADKGPACQIEIVGEEILPAYSRYGVNPESIVALAFAIEQAA